MPGACPSSTRGSRAAATIMPRAVMVGMERAVVELRAAVLRKFLCVGGLIAHVALRIGVHVPLQGDHRHGLRFALLRFEGRELLLRPVLPPHGQARDDKMILESVFA